MGADTLEIENDPSWNIEIAHFAECILTNQPITKGTSEDALKVMEIIDKVYQLPIIHMDKLNPGK